MRRKDEFDWDDRPSPLGSMIVGIVALLIIAIIGVGVYFLVFKNDRQAVHPETIVGEEIDSAHEELASDGSETEDDQMSQGSGEAADSRENLNVDGENLTQEEAAEDPQSQINQEGTEQGTETVITEILTGTGVAETEGTTMGIDVSRYQGVIDWEQVAGTGIDFVMVRVGYRTMKTGEIVEDDNAAYNLQEATANGLKVGAYFFSTAVTKEEAIEEAKWTKDFISKYRITYPVAFNCEGYNNAENRQYALTKEERTELAKAFLYEIYEGGYTPMFYASKGEMEGDSQWIISEIEKQYKVWVSWYPGKPYPETPEADYSGTHAMWQYTNNGTVAGIDYPVDVNVAYFAYEQEAEAKNTEAPEHVEADIESMHNFSEVNETVTAKDATNLRNIPSQGEDSQVMLTLYNGQTATRTGTSTSGWSRVIYNGETYYAVSSYLTTDLTPKTPEPTAAPVEDDGIQTVFTECNDRVSPKEAVNLRTLPSVTNPESVVVVKLPYGSIVNRTGINTDVGWSRVEYEGQVLYCVSSYVYVVEEVAE